MTAREYAKECGVELVGKLAKKVSKVEKFNYVKGIMEVISTTFYIDEAGTEITGSKKDGWCLTTAEGDIY